MKLYNRIIIGVLAVMAFACSERDLPYADFDDLAFGAYARAEEGPTGVFNYFDVENSAYTFRVEFYDENQGRNVSSYVWTVEYLDSRNNVIIGKKPFRSFQASDFVTNARGLPGLTATFTFQQAIDALGTTIDQLDGGNKIRFEATITKTDGSTFSINNTDGNLIGQPAFKALFRIDANIVCPSDLGGVYTSTTTGTSTDPCCPDVTTVTGEVTLTDNGNGEYTISDWSAGMYFTWYEIYGITAEYVAAGNLAETIIDACGNISGSFAEPFGTNTTITGSVDPSTGVITYSWINGYDDEATVVLTPQ